MPRFIGEFQSPDQHGTGFQQVFEFLLQAPQEAGYGKDALIPALLILDEAEDEEEDTVISKGLAEDLAAASGVWMLEEGGVVEVHLREVAFDGAVSRLKLPVRVKFAVDEENQQYIRLSLCDVCECFHVYKIILQSGGVTEVFIDLKIREGIDPTCEDEPPPAPPPPPSRSPVPVA